MLLKQYRSRIFTKTLRNTIQSIVVNGYVQVFTPECVLVLEFNRRSSSHSASRGGGGGGEGVLVPLHILLYVMFDKYDGLLIVGVYVLLMQQKMIQLAWTMCMKISISSNYGNFQKQLCCKY